MPSYKLTYFNGRGRAEGCRLMFALAGVEFEDKRVNSDEWKELKPSVKTGQLPMMEIDGVQFGQSRALVTYLAREFGYYGKTNMDALKIEIVLSTLEDFMQSAIKAMFAKEEEKEAKLKEFKEEQAPKHMSNLETLFKENGTGFYVGDSVTVADIAVFDFVSGQNSRNPGCMDSYPGVKCLVEKIGNMDKIKAWVEKRPVSQF